MNNHITFRQLTHSLDANNLAYGVMTLPQGARLVITRLGGRIFGPFLPDMDESLYWINAALAQPESLRRFIDSGGWNLGGERVWIAPEIQFIIQERANFWGTHRLPAGIEPGHYALQQTSAGQWRLQQTITLRAYNIASGETNLTVERLIQPLPDPLRALRSYIDLTSDVLFAGYEQVVTLAEQQSTGIMSEAWNLVQINPGGQLVVPALPVLEASPYLGTVPEEATCIQNGHLRIAITGQQQYKVGYKAAHVTGRMGYFNSLTDGRAYLMVRNFFNNPSNVYAEEPPDAPGVHGHSIHVYHDGGQLGGFGEMECTGQTIGGQTGRFASTDAFQMWVYVGASEKIAVIGTHLLGVAL